MTQLSLQHTVVVPSDGGVEDVSVPTDDPGVVVPPDESLPPAEGRTLPTAVSEPPAEVSVPLTDVPVPPTEESVPPTEDPASPTDDLASPVEVPVPTDVESVPPTDDEPVYDPERSTCSPLPPKSNVLFRP